MAEQFECPRCRQTVSPGQSYCNYCKTALDWAQPTQKNLAYPNYRVEKINVPPQKPQQKPLPSTRPQAVNFDRLAFLVIFIVLAYAILEPLLRSYTIWVTGTFLLLLAILVFCLIKYPAFRQGLFSAFKSIFAKLWDWVTTQHEKREGNQITTNAKPRRTPIPIDVQRQVIGRAKNRCQWEWCQIKGNLELHHMDGNPSNHKINNLIYLCPNHHQDAHDHKARIWQLRDWANSRYSS